MEAVEETPVMSEKKPRTEKQKAAMEAARLKSLAEKKSGPPPLIVFPDDGAHAVLQDMRHVYANPKCYDTTLQHRHTRKYFEKTPERFRLQMLAFEKEHRELKKSRAEKEKVEADLGVERCMELIGEWLEDNT